MKVAGKSSEELGVDVVPVSTVSAYLLTKYTKLLGASAAIAAELQKIGAVSHAANRVAKQSKDARRRRTNFALHNKTKILEGGDVTRLTRKHKAIYGNGEARCNGSSCGSTYVVGTFKPFRLVV